MRVPEYRNESILGEMSRFVFGVVATVLFLALVVVGSAMFVFYGSIALTEFLWSAASIEPQTGLWISVTTTSVVLLGIFFFILFLLFRPFLHMRRA